MNDSLTILLFHSVNTLPDSLTERKEVLAAVANLITSKHQGFELIQAQLAAIATVEQLQQQLPHKFRKAA